MTNGPGSKIMLKSIHQDIDLLDRKIAHASNFEVFDSADQKQKTIDRFNTKRDKLVKTARELMENGVEWDDNSLPRSFRTDTPKTKVEETTPVQATEPAKPQSAFGASIANAEAEQRANNS